METTLQPLHEVCGQSVLGLHCPWSMSVAIVVEADLESTYNSNSIAVVRIARLSTDHDYFSFRRKASIVLYSDDLRRHIPIVLELALRPCNVPGILGRPNDLVNIFIFV
jgi:hypothetical protein